MTEVKQIYTIIEKEDPMKNQWIKVGVGFVNRDQSINIRLDSLPSNGLLHVRDMQKSGKKNGEEPKTKKSSPPG